MSTPIRVQLRRTHGWRMPENTVSVARPGPWGNPFHAGAVDVGTCVALYKNSLRGWWHPATAAHLPNELFHMVYVVHCDWLARWRRRAGCLPIEAIGELRGKNLACWCALDAPCHADVLLRLANEERPS